MPDETVRMQYGDLEDFDGPNSYDCVFILPTKVVCYVSCFDSLGHTIPLSYYCPNFQLFHLAVLC
jgi:hypothetical protein